MIEVSKEVFLEMLRLKLIKNGKKGSEKTWTITGKGKKGKRKKHLVPPDVAQRFERLKNSRK